MQRILKLFHKEFTSVGEAALLLALATVASNFLALIRDRLLASRFGAGVELDIYYAAFRVPDFLYTLSLFFVASTAIIPLFLEKRSQNEEAGVAFLETIFIAFFVSISSMAFIAYLVLPFLMPFLVPGFTAEARAETVELSRILLLSPLFLGLSNLVSSVLQSFRKFFAYAASFLFYNLGIIAGILFLAPRYGLKGIAGGVVVGAFLHVGIQIPSFLRLGYRPRLLIPRAALLSDIIRRSFPRTVGLAVSQATLFVVTILASFAGVGSIAVFQLAYNLQSIPLAVIGLSYSVAAFPTMAALIVKKERSIFFDHLVSASRHIIFWTLPITVLFIVLRAHIVRVVLGAGEFGWADTRLTAASLALFAIGIMAQSLVALFIRALYAIGNTRVPVLINLFSTALTIFLAIFFMAVLKDADHIAQVFSAVLRVENIANSAVLGLPLAYALGACVNALLLGLSLGWVEGEFYPRRLGNSLVEIGSGSILLGFTSYGMLQITDSFFDFDRFWGVFLHGSLAGFAGIGIAVLFLYVKKNKELMEVREMISHKFWKKETFGPEQEHL